MCKVHSHHFTMCSLSPCYSHVQLPVHCEVWTSTGHPSFHEDRSQLWVSILIGLYGKKVTSLSPHISPQELRSSPGAGGAEVKVKKVVGCRCDAIGGMFDWFGLAEYVGGHVWPQMFRNTLPPIPPCSNTGATLCCNSPMRQPKALWQPGCI